MYSKLFHKILDSSIWLENHATVRVWITLLASMDEHGMCEIASEANLARRANVSAEEVREAVKVLEGPDPNSADPDNEGRRIARVPGGWIVLNAAKYRALVTRKEGQRLSAERSRNYRDRKKKKSVTNVTQRDEVAERHATVTQSYTDTDISYEVGTPEERVATLPLRPDGEPDYSSTFTFKGKLPNGFDY